MDLDLILDKRCKTNTLNTLGNKYLTECITSKDNTKDLIEIMAKYYPQSFVHRFYSIANIICEFAKQLR